MRSLILFLLSSFLLAACGPTQPVPTPDLVKFYATSAAYPHVAGLYHCAPQSVVLAVSDPDSAQLTLRLGEPNVLTTPAFQIGKEDILVVVHPEVGVGTLTLEQVRRLFSGDVTNWKNVGASDLAVQVWGFSPGEDVQEAFDRTVMNGQPLTSLARLAVSAQNMSESVAATPGSIGLLPRRWKAGGNIREVFNAGSVPVLVVTKAPPEGAVKDLIGCLQAGE